MGRGDRKVPGQSPAKGNRKMGGGKTKIPACLSAAAAETCADLYRRKILGPAFKDGAAGKRTGNYPGVPFAPAAALPGGIAVNIPARLRKSRAAGQQPGRLCQPGF